MNTTLTPAMTKYATRALEVGLARNILTEQDRADFARSIAEHDEKECAAWSGIVAFDLAQRCRSFTPADLTELNGLREAAGW